MSEKIKEFAELAGIVIIPNSRPISIMGLTTDLEKFAELIVKECSAPLRRPWVVLTDEELESMAEQYVTDCYFDTLKYGQAIQSKLKEKNV